jgi:hypothetical protein
MTPLPIDTKVKSIHDVFMHSQAFVVPEYQRSYQWGESQIQSLVRDIHMSICSIAKSSSLDHEIRFLGSIITIVQTAGLQHNHYGSLQPNVFHEIVDGQQRLTTFALLASVLHQMVRDAYVDVAKDEYAHAVIDKLKHVVNRYEKQLEVVYAYKLQQMTKDFVLPAIIRAENDRWEDNKGSFRSQVARLLHQHIHPNNESGKNAHREVDIVVKNVLAMRKLLSQHSMGGFPTIDDDNEEPSFYQPYDVVIRLNALLWHGNYSDLSTAVLHDSARQDTPLLRLARLLIFTNVFLHRCYLNHVYTGDERWAFDMFIGLNTSGIPLSAVETFRAYLMQKAKALPNAGLITQRIQDLFINHHHGIELYFDREKKATERAKRVKEYVTTLALYLTGEKVGYHIHEQRMYLKKTYDLELQKVQDFTAQQHIQLEFIQNMQQFTQYCVHQDALLSQDAPVLAHLQSDDASRRDAAMLCIGFLADANHTIVDALLARFYSRVGQRRERASYEFEDVCMAVAAFFVLWRTVRGTNGLPDVHRELMESFSVKGSNSHWNSVTVKSSLRDKLKATESHPMNLLDREIWVREASQIRARRMKEITRFILLMVSHQTSHDTHHPGLMQKGANGYQPYATLVHWRSRDLKSIEHIAPQSKTQGWDSSLYDPQSNLVDSLGNLVLMPVDLNSSLQNNIWPMKWTYYQYLALGNADLRDRFFEEMKQKGITLQKSTMQLLNKSTYAGHMDPIVAVGIDGRWDADLVQLRTKRMLEIFHDRMMQWLKVEE